MRQETTYQCPDNPKHKQTVYFPVKQVVCGKHSRPVIMHPLPPKEET